jgi:hypothetical protein
VCLTCRQLCYSMGTAAAAGDHDRLLLGFAALSSSGRNPLPSRTTYLHMAQQTMQRTWFSSSCERSGAYQVLALPITCDMAKPCVLVITHHWKLS